MNFYLYLMRHAKSDWSEQGLPDFDRPINSRGKKNVTQVGQWLADNKLTPERVISSSALRARETTELLIQQLDNVSLEDVHFDKDLYLAPLDILLESIQLYKQNYKSLMLVAHNPGIEQLVNYLVDNADGLITITTANLVLFEFADCHFNLETDKATLIELIRPKELE